MASWHQERAGKALPKLSHPTKWSSYNPVGHLSVMRHENQESCMKYCKNTGDIPIAPDSDQSRTTQRQKTEKGTW
jgi:hypothetical protein